MPAIAKRIRTCWSGKVAVCLGLAVGICVPYFTLQRIDVGIPATVPAIFLDQLIRFQPGWIWAYVSLAGLVPLAPLVATDRDALVRYAKGLTLLCVPSFVLFGLFPVAGPRPELGPDSSLYGLLVASDRPTNSLPSLHAGLTIYSLLVADRLLRADLSARARLGARLLGWGWGAAILYATLATKQHWALDLPAGIGLGAAAYWLAWHARKPASPSARAQAH